MIMLDQPCCLICSDPVFQRCLPCRCIVCAPCIAQWLTSEVQEHFLNGDNYIRCPNLNCHEKSSIISVLSNLPHEHHQSLSGLLLKTYIQEAPDVINCQKGSCNYYGVMPQKDCTDDLICELCGHKWKEKTQLTSLERIYSRVSNVNDVISEIQTAVYHGLFTVPCPQCSVPIRKAGGCSHMTCKKCAYEFCWTCEQNFQKHSTEQCVSNQFAKLAIVSLFVFQVLIISGPYHMLWSILTGGVSLFLKMCFFNLTFLVFILVIFPLICLWKERSGDKKKLIWYVLWFAVMAYVMSQNIPYLFYNYVGEMVWLLGAELVLICIIFAIHFIVQSWLKFVL